MKFLPLKCVLVSHERCGFFYIMHSCGPQAIWTV